MSLPSDNSKGRDSVIPYAPGERVPYSGIYRAQHVSHRSTHEVTVVQGGFFPWCRVCGAELRFVPVRIADRLHEDYDFPVIEAVSPRLRRGLH
jgi:hypothetical protein